MKKYLIAVVTFVLLMIGFVPSANADKGGTHDEKETITVTVPSTLEGCARVREDILGISDIYVDHNGKSEFVVTYSIIEEYDYFTVAAYLMSEHHYLNNPQHPGLASSAFFRIEKCPDVVLPPIVPPTYPGEMETMPIIKTPEEVTEGPVETPVPDYVVETPKPVEAKQEAPVVKSAPIVETPLVKDPPVVQEELAATGFNEFLFWIAIALIVIGGALVIFNKKLGFKNA